MAQLIVKLDEEDINIDKIGKNVKITPDNSIFSVIVDANAVGKLKSELENYTDVLPNRNFSFTDNICVFIKPEGFVKWKAYEDMYLSDEDKKDLSYYQNQESDEGFVSFPMNLFFNIFGNEINSLDNMFTGNKFQFI